MKCVYLLRYSMHTMTDMKRVVIYIPADLYKKIEKASKGKPISQTIRRILEYVLGWR